MKIRGSTLTLRGPQRDSVLCDEDECCDRGPSLGMTLAGAFGAVLATKGAEALWDRLFPKPSESDDGDDMTVEGLLGAVREAVADEVKVLSERMDATDERLDALEKPRRRSAK